MLILVFDTETTGLPRDRKCSIKDTHLWPHIIQFSWVIYDDEKKEVIEEYDQIIKLNGIVIPEESIAIHGITNEISQSRGIDILEALYAFKNGMRKCGRIVGHNLSFDKKMIMVETIRNKIFFKFCQDEYCTMKKSCKDKFLKLGELHNNLFGFIPENLHNSKQDVNVCLKCYIELNKKI